MIYRQYAPVSYAWDGETRAYTFDFELIGPIAFEVWFEGPGEYDDTYQRHLIEPQYYNLELGSKPPLHRGGTVTLTGDIPDWVETISIERNTPITQLQDFSNFDARPFWMDLIEFGIDILTMIIQELAERKCSVVIAGDIDQLLSIDAYKPLYASSLDFMIDKVNDYCVEMDSTGADCSSNPEGTGVYDTERSKGKLGFSSGPKVS